MPLPLFVELKMSAVTLPVTPRVVPIVAELLTVSDVIDTLLLLTVKPLAPANVPPKLYCTCPDDPPGVPLPPPDNKFVPTPAAAPVRSI